MPKVKTTVRQKLSKIVNKYPKYLSFDATLHLLCTLCQVTINYDENHISSHFNGKKHREKVENNEKSQQHILNAFDKSEKSLRKNEYFEDLANAFLSADIPFEKLLNQKFKSFLEKYTKKNRLDYSKRGRVCSRRRRSINYTSLDSSRPYESIEVILEVVRGHPRSTRKFDFFRSNKSYFDSSFI
jgi:hypothetical protein